MQSAPNTSDSFAQLFMWGALLLALLVAMTMVWLWLRRRILGNETEREDVLWTLQDLRDMMGVIEAEPAASDVRPVSHGNAWSIYFPDPEGNLVEVYLASPFYVPQPHGSPLDLELSDDEILRATEEQVRAVDGFMTQEEWKSKVAGELQGNA